VLNLLNTSDPFEPIKQKLVNKLENYVTQNKRKINQIYAHYNLTDLIDNAASKTKISNVEKHFFELVELRHKIAHDLNLDESNKITPLGIPNNVFDNIKGTIKLVESCEDIISNKGI